jgi:hypothetical protein
VSEPAKSGAPSPPRRAAGRGPWIAAACLLLAALGLAAWRAIALRPPPDPPPPPAPVAAPAELLLVAGRIDGTRVARRALLALPDGAELALREESVFAADRLGDVLRLRLDAGELLVDGGGETAVRTPHAEFAGRDAVFVVRSSPAGSALVVLHGAVVVSAGTFRVEITRDETVDVAPDGRLGGAVRIDPVAATEWSTSLLAQASRLRNGGFERELEGWTAPAYAEARVRVDRRAHSGRRSVLLEFNAVAEYRHESPASDPVESSARRLRLRGYVEHADLECGPGGGVFVEVRDASGSALARSPVWSGSRGWRKFHVDFDRPEGSGPLRVVCRRVENGAPTQGRLRLDDLALLELVPAGP